MTHARESPDSEQDLFSYLHHGAGQPGVSGRRGSEDGGGGRGAKVQRKGRLGSGGARRTAKSEEEGNSAAGGTEGSTAQTSPSSKGKYSGNPVARRLAELEAQAPRTPMSRPVFETAPSPTTPGGTRTAFTVCGTPLPVHHHIDVPPAAPEPFNMQSIVARKALVGKRLTEDACRAATPSAMNRVVFDSIDTENQRALRTAANNMPAESNSGVPSLTPGTPMPLSFQSIFDPTAASSSSALMTAFGQPPADESQRFYEPTGIRDTTLVFESRFESGNLRQAVQVGDYEYDLVLRPDIHTNGEHTQWFYFSVENMRANRPYKFNMVNLIKPNSMYNFGMRPLLYSERAASERGVGWRRAGTDICYYQNHRRRDSRHKHYMYTLSFTVRFEASRDRVFLAYCYPYTYTQLQMDLSSYEARPQSRRVMRRRKLCETLAGNRCDLLTITDFDAPLEEIAKRKGVVFTARVHPGESNSSHIMKGILEFLISSSRDAKALRSKCVFKVVPMLNPDGVIHGNYRCSLSGVDLNRQWKDPSRTLHPTIYYTKQMIKQLQKDRPVVMYTDLHGHSRKENAFIYGCEAKSGSPHQLLEQIFPRIFWNEGSHYFSFNNSNFKVQRSKSTTARIVVWREFGIINSYTLETSFAGCDFGPLKNHHFASQELQRLGALFCRALLRYLTPEHYERARAALFNLHANGVKTHESESDVSDEDDDSETKSRSKGSRRTSRKRRETGKRRGKNKSRGSRNKDTQQPIVIPTGRRSKSRKGKSTSSRRGGKSSKALKRKASSKAKKQQPPPPQVTNPPAPPPPPLPQPSEALNSSLDRLERSLNNIEDLATELAPLLRSEVEEDAVDPVAVKAEEPQVERVPSPSPSSSSFTEISSDSDAGEEEEEEEVEEEEEDDDDTSSSEVEAPVSVPLTVVDGTTAGLASRVERMERRTASSLELSEALYTAKVAATKRQAKLKAKKKRRSSKARRRASKSTKSRTRKRRGSRRSSRPKRRSSTKSTPRRRSSVKGSKPKRSRSSSSITAKKEPVQTKSKSTKRPSTGTGTRPTPHAPDAAHGRPPRSAGGQVVAGEQWSFRELGLESYNKPPSLPARRLALRRRASDRSMRLRAQQGLRRPTATFGSATATSRTARGRRVQLLSKVPVSRPSTNMSGLVVSSKSAAASSSGDEPRPGHPIIYSSFYDDVDVALQQKKAGAEEPRPPAGTPVNVGVGASALVRASVRRKRASIEDVKQRAQEAAVLPHWSETFVKRAKADPKNKS